jgi:hypothetical protein
MRRRLAPPIGFGGGPRKPTQKGRDRHAHNRPCGTRMAAERMGAVAASVSKMRPRRVHDTDLDRSVVVAREPTSGLATR